MLDNKKYTVLLILITLAGCATYTTRPLPTTPNLVASVPQLSVDPARLPLPNLQAHRFDPSDGLDITEVATLAVINNPDLKLARDDAHIAQAQAFAAGLLPDPQLSLTRDIPTGSGPGLTSAFNAGISEDLNALLTHGIAKAAAHSEQKKADLELLWKEWQVISQARDLFVKLLGQRRQMAVLQDSFRLADRRYALVRRALAQGNETTDAMTANLTAVEDLRRQIDDLARKRDKNAFDLNELLGLAPQLRLDLTGSPDLPTWSAQQVRNAVQALPRYRPDLLALQAGYRAQDEHYRQAILAQFPALNVGFTRARDTSGIYTSGFSISLSLPFLNRNRGNVAIEQATRSKLHDEYQTRLNQADSDAERLLTERTRLCQQKRRIDAATRQLQRAAAAADMALHAGNMDYLAYANVQGALLAVRLEAIDVDTSLLEQRIALQALLGGELPSERQP